MASSNVYHAFDENQFYERSVCNILEIGLSLDQPNKICDVIYA